MKIVSEGKTSVGGMLALTACGLLVLVLVLGGILGGVAGLRAFGRAQRLADERNQVAINDIQIAQTAQLVKVEQQKAAVRVAEAQGIAQAQQIINQSLTPLYLQHEAIQAEQAMAGSPNHTVVYIPVGNNGIPIVATTDPQATAAESSAGGKK